MSPGVRVVRTARYVGSAGPRSSLAALAWLLLGLIACRTPGTLEPDGRLDPLAQEARREVGALVEQVRALAATRGALRASGRVAVRSPQGSGSARQVVLAERPARLRLETLNFLGQTQSLLVTDGETFAFYDGRELTRGAAGDDVMLDRLGIDLAPDATVSLLLATPPVAPGALVAGLGNADVRVAVLEGQRLWFDASGELARVETYDAAGRVRWRVRYGRWREVQGARYPFEIVLDFPLTSLRAELALDSVELDPVIDRSLFRLPGGDPE